MSFGFSIGDVVTVARLARSLWKGFAEAPEHCKAIRSEVAGLYIVLDDVARSSSTCDLSEQQNLDLSILIQGCLDVLNSIETVLRKQGILAESCSGLRLKTKRAWERLKWDQGDIQEMRNRLVSNTTLLDAFNSSISSQITHDVKLGIEGLDRRVEDLQSRNDQQERETIISWLSTLDFRAQHQDFIRRKEPGTGLRFLGDDKFTTWQAGKHGQLFCPGIPGAGKTIMAAAVVDHLQDTFGEYSKGTNIGIIYLYCNYRRQLEQSALDLLGSLARQLAYQQPGISEELQELYHRHVDKKSRPSLEEITKLIQTEIGRFGRVFIVLDALDECINSHDTRRILASTLQTVVIQTDTNLLLTSRFIPEVTAMFKHCPQLEIRAQVEDVQAYLRAQLGRLPKFVMRNITLQDTIVTSVAKAVDGMFLLAQLHLDSLTDKMNPKAMKVALEKLPKGSDALRLAYDSAVDRIDAQKSGLRDLADQVLSWITIARRPLRTEELQHALAIEVDETYLDEDNFSDLEEIIGACAGLVTIDEYSKVIRFIHYTTQEYFESIRHERFKTAVDHVTLSCITYLMYDSIEDSIRENDKQSQLKGKLPVQLQNQLVHNYPLIEYAAEHWGHHVRESSKELITPSALRLLRSDDRLMLCVHLGMRQISIQRRSSRQVALFVAASFGLEDAVKELIADGADVDCKLDGETALYVSCSRGYVGVVELLLDAGADIELTGGSKGTALSTAAYHGHDEIVRILIPRSFAWWRHGTALEQATSGGHIDTVQLLLAEGADINSPFGAGDNLSRAIENGNEQIVQMYLDKGVGTISSRTIEIAAREGDLNIVRSLIERKTGPETAKEWVEVGITAAASRGHKGVVRFLFESVPSLDLSTALVQASRNGDLDMIIFLCNLLESSLYDSSYRRDKRSLHVDLNDLFRVTDKTWHEMLSEAVLFQHEDIAEWLSKRRGTLNPSNDVILNASKVYNFKIVEMIWDISTHKTEEGRERRIWDQVWAQQLLHGCESGNTEVVEWLLRNGVSVNPRYHDDEKMSPRITPLLAAAWKGHPEIVRLLLKHGATDESMKSHQQCSDAELDHVVAGLMVKWSSWWREQTRLDGWMEKPKVDSRTEKPKRFWSAEPGRRSSLRGVEGYIS